MTIQELAKKINALAEINPNLEVVAMDMEDFRLRNAEVDVEITGRTSKDKQSTTGTPVVLINLFC